MAVIVVIDDRVTNRKILARLAASLEQGALVKSFADPAEALAWAKNNTPDLVITDFKMPGMDGAAFTRRFRTQPLCADVPVMVVTVFEDREFRYRALEAGATDFLLSPIDHREFKVRGRNLLTLRRHELLIKNRASELKQQLHLSGRRHEEEIRRGKAHLLAVIDTVPAMISATDDTGRFSFVNRYLASFLAINPDDAVGKTACDLYGESLGATRMEVDRRILETGEAPPPYEEEFNLSEGEVRVLLTTKRPLRDSRGVTTNVVTVSLDISERKEDEEALRWAKEEAEAASRSKTEFLANMSHELRTPLNAIIGFSEMMESSLLGPIGNAKYVEYASNIGRSAHHLLGIIKDILEVSKIEAGAVNLQEEEVQVPTMIADVLQIIGARAEEADLDIALDLADDLPLLRADERKLKQIVLNLLSNAIKFTPSGGRLEIAASKTLDGAIKFRIADTGIGMADSDIACAMDRFGQVGDVTTRQQHQHGTGLGLPLTIGLVELHGGRLDIASEEGEGTTVTVLFPPERSVAGKGGSYEKQNG